VRRYLVRDNVVTCLAVGRYLVRDNVVTCLAVGRYLVRDNVDVDGPRFVPPGWVPHGGGGVFAQHSFEVLLDCRVLGTLPAAKDARHCRSSNHTFTSSLFSCGDAHYLQGRDGTSLPLVPRVKEGEKRAWSVAGSVRGVGFGYADPCGLLT